ncbi:putative transcriptional regulatory protein [Escovopsis weberi]|uniref:Putative transcriptional regulatory protein n=1 Tax=Escovopsis weberi TaxID=150374 RepID=A0A0M9VTW1_ESCWE|nr:putative transcriptional regulatory protein [Escovopsis weberi]
MAVPMASLAGATRSHLSIPSRPAYNILRAPRVCQQCLRPRPFSATAPRDAGHNKWSKVKHVKAVTDKKKMAERLNFTKLIALYSKMYGDDVKSNPQLASSIAAATKGMPLKTSTIIPKALIEAAIARGQGRSATGAQLEPLTLEVLMPPNIALVVDVETDNKTRSLHDLKFVVKKAGGVVGSTTFFFSRRGRAVFKGKGTEQGPSLTEVMDEALEHEGVEDVEEAHHHEGGCGYQIWTEPGRLMAVTEAIAQRLDLEILESDIVWAPNGDTMVDAEASADVEGLGAMLSSLREYTEVKAIYANIRQGAVEDGEWEKIERHIDV